jgi:DNA-binding HxlR family transcriptional regulator
VKLVKVTQKTKSLKNRWYDDACGTALALELVGERWSLLIVRELMYGGRRFGELRANLPGISANVLTQRLESLESTGVLARRKLPPPASVQIYELTDWGRQSETAIQELGRWAVRSPLHDPTLHMSASSAMMSLRTMFNRALAAGLQARIGFRFGAEGFIATIGDWIEVERAEPGGDVIFDTDPMTFVSIVYGGRPIADAEAAGDLRLTGDRALAERFVTLFPLPPKTD